MTTWLMHVQIEFPVVPADVEKRHEGDAEVDFSRRALERVRPYLETLLDGIGMDAEYAHYWILRQPTRGGIEK